MENAIVKYLGIGIVVLFILLVLGRLGMRPAKYRDLDTPGLRSLLDLLYVRGLDGGFLHVAVIKSQQFVRVYKCIHRPDVVSLELHIPRSTYQHLEVPTAMDTLNALGAHVFTGQPRGVASGEPRDSLVIDCGPGISRALVVLESVLRDVLQLDPERQCVAHIEGARLARLRDLEL